MPPTVTTTLPVVAPTGTGAIMLEALQLVGVVLTPLKLTVLVPWEAPKFAPAIVTEALIAPADGLRLVMLGRGGVTVKLSPLLAIPATETTTFPVVAPVGTGTAILVALQLVGNAPRPLNPTALACCEDPKPEPVMVTEVPAGPDVGLILVMLGGRTVKLTPLLATPLTVTTTLPVVVTGTWAVMLVAVQLVAITGIPLNATVLVP